jgi:glycosyltransferase involved in cell wall biosynthesis
MIKIPLRWSGVGAFLLKREVHFREELVSFPFPFTDALGEDEIYIASGAVPFRLSSFFMKLRSAIYWFSALLCLSLVIFIPCRGIIRQKILMRRLVKNSWISPSLLDSYRRHKESGCLPHADGKFRIVFFCRGGPGDTQTQRRLSQMAERLGWEWAVIFRRRNQAWQKQHRSLIKKLNPHCILHHHTDEDYLMPEMINLLTIHFPLDLVDNTAEKKNFTLMGRYDGFLLCPALEKVEAFRRFMVSSGKKFLAIPAYLTSRRTPFADTPKAKLFFCGGNWDDRGNEEYFKLWRTLSATGYFETYGQSKAWKDPLTGRPVKAYRGELPSVADAVYEKMRECGISLVIHGRMHREADCPSARIFEAASASCVIISDELPFTKRHFGDSVLYVDTTKSADEMFRAINNQMRWILAHPAEAQELARRSHQIFCENFALEDLTRDILDLYESVKQDRVIPNSRVIGD